MRNRTGNMRETLERAISKQKIRQEHKHNRWENYTARWEKVSRLWNDRDRTLRERSSKETTS